MKIGIIICGRYSSCAGGKCFRALKNREGAFSIYKRIDNLELVGFTTCGGCPGGNIENAMAEMVKNGAEAIHLATGFVVGYPPCPYLSYFVDFLKIKYRIKVVVGTHPIPQKYYLTHKELGTWNQPEWEANNGLIAATEKERLSYD